MLPRPVAIAAAIAAAIVLLVALATFAMWPRDDDVTVWTDSDLEPTVTEADAEASELTAQRREITAGTAPDVTDPPDDDPARTLTLRGRVVDTRGVPIGGASVHLELRGAGRERVRQPVTTGSDGSFAFRGARRSVRTVGVSASHADYAPAAVDRELPTGDASDVFTLGDITLGRGASVQGVVLHAAGPVLLGATVELSAESANSMLWSKDGRPSMPTTTSDGRGGFTFTRVPPGVYRVFARATRMVSTNSDTFSVIDDNDVTLPPITLQPGTLLVGLVIDRRGRGIEKAQVVVSGVTPGPQQRATTDRDGRFVLDHLRPRSSELRVTASGYVAHRQQVDLATQQDLTISLDDGLRLRGQVRDATTGQPITTFAVQPRRLRSVSQPMPAEHAGRTREDLNQQMLEASRAPTEARDDPARLARIASLRLAVQALDTARAEAAAATSPESTALPQDPGPSAPHKDGAFDLTGLDEGVYAVDVRADDFLMTRSDRVELRVGLDAPMLQIDLRRGFTLRGHVVRTSDGTGIGKARVELMLLTGAASNDVKRLRGPTIANAISDADGTFTLRNVRPGRCATRVVARGFDTTVGQALDVQADVVGLRIELGARATLHGRVLGVPSGRELDVTLVAFATFRNIVSRKLDADGSYRLEDLQPGAYHVRAYLAESSAAVRRMNAELAQAPPPDVTLAPGEERAMDLALTLVPFATVRGTVRVNGLAASGFQVQLRGSAPPHNEGRSWVPTHAQQVEPDGAFAFLAVEPGSYELRLLSIARDRIELARQPVLVVQGQDSQVLVDVGAATCEGQLIAPEDGHLLDGVIKILPHGVPGFEVSERPTDGREINVRVRGGKFRADVLPTGAFTLELHGGNDREVVRVDAEFAAGEHKTLTLIAGALRKRPADDRK